MSFASACVLAVLLQAGPLHQAARAPADERSPRFEKLSNGLRMCVIEDHALPLVSVQLWFKVGSSFDPPTQPGLTHLAMCALEQATLGDSAPGAAGAYHKATTLRDACYFHSAFGVDGTPPDRTPDALDRALRREAERFAPGLITRATLKNALEAAARRGADPIDVRTDRGPLLNAMFPGHPYRWPPEIVGDWTRRADDAALREHIERWFTPTNATLFVIGDVSTDATIAAFRQHFSSIEWRDTPRRADFDPPPDERPLPPATQSASPTEMIIAWLTPPFGSFENAAIDVLMQRLCNPIDGPISRRLSAAGWSRPQCARQGWRNCGMVTFRVIRIRTVESSPGSAPFGSIADIVDEELRKIAADGVEVVELNRARALARRQSLDSRAGFLSRARSLAEHEIIGGDVLLDAYDTARASHVSAGDIAFAARLLETTRRVVLDSSKWQDERPATAAAEPVPHEWRLDEIAGDPQLATALSNWAARTRQERELGEHVRIECLPVVGSGLAWFSIQPGPALRFSERLPLILLSPRRQDYLSYYGLTLTVNPKDGTLDGSGAVDRIDSLLELAVRAIRESSPQPPAAEQWRIRCMGGVTTDDLEKAARAACE